MPPGDGDTPRDGDQPNLEPTPSGTDDLLSGPPPAGDATVAAPSAGPKVAITLAVVVAILAAAAVFVLRSSSTGGVLDANVPADVTLFAEANLRPGGDQAAAIDSILGRLTDAQRDSVTTGFEDGLESAFRGIDLSWRDNVKGWIGTRIGVAMSLDAATLINGPTPVVLLSVRDEGAAQDALTRASAKVDDLAFEVADGVAFLAEEPAHITNLRAAADRGTLDTNEAYLAARSRAGEVIGFMWVNGQGLAGLAGAVPGLPAGADTTAAIALRAEESAIVVEGFSASADEVSGGSTPAILESTSAALLGSLTFFDLGSALEAALAPGIGGPLLGQIPGLDFVLAPFEALDLDIERDVAAWMKGEISILVGGFSGAAIPDIGVVAEVTDEDALARMLRKIERNIADFGRAIGADLSATRSGEDLVIGSGGFGGFIRRAPGRVAVASNPAYAGSLLETSPRPLGDDAVYRRAVGSDGDATTFQLFVRVDRIRDLALAFLPAEARAAYEQSAGPLVSQLEAFSIRSTSGPDESTFRMVLTLTE